MNSTTRIVVVLAGLASLSSGDTVEFTFTGQIDTIGGSIAAPFNLGEDLQVRYRFDTDAVDADPADNFGAYNGALRRPALQIGSWEWSQSVNGDLGVLDNGFAGDSYSATIQQPLLWFAVNLTNFGGDAFTSDALPADLDFDQWQSRNFAVEMVVGPAYWNAGGTLTGFSSRIVPAPAVGSIGMVVTGVLTGRRRRTLSITLSASDRKPRLW